VKKIVFLPEALADLREALLWYQDKSARAGARLYTDLQKILTSIQARPQSYAKRDAIFRRANLHRFPYTLSTGNSNRRFKSSR
jgi:plasmid stabilization system protein ParE